MPPHDRDRQSPATAAKLLGLVNSSWMSHAVCVAAQLRLADMLANGPRRCDDLAQAAGCHAPSLRRLLRALATIDVCIDHQDGTFELTPMGALLRADAPDSVRSWVIWWGSHLSPVWANLLHSIRTGEDARSLVTGAKGFESLESDPEVAATFNTAMVELTRLMAREVIAAFDFSGIRRIVDVGGGFGELLAAILNAHPSMRGVLFDRPHAIDGARAHLDRAGVLDRCEVVAGDFFEGVPAGADAYLLKSVIHDWDDAHGARILQSCRRAMSPDARLLLIEHLMPDHMEPGPRHQSMARLDLNMLVAHGARERTEAEFHRLLEAQRLRVARIVPTGASFCVIEAAPC